MPNWTKFLVAILVAGAGIVVFVKMYIDSETRALVSEMEINENKHETRAQSSSLLINTKHYIEQRNNLSRILNMKQQTVGQMDCEVNAV